MAKAGDTIESPVSGARIVFLKTARDTDGELLQLDDVMKGGGRVPIEHVHPHMEERFEILSGSACLSMRGKSATLVLGRRSWFLLAHRMSGVTRAKRRCTSSSSSGRR
jgi:hypothetical protein